MDNNPSKELFDNVCRLKLFQTFLYLIKKNPFKLINVHLFLDLDDVFIVFCLNAFTKSRGINATFLGKHQIQKEAP